jgi:sterol desaturase/sphingolipid hydroxylase (fatty acid hydroxylase superfamily)
VPEQLRDPVLFAIPFFILFLALEAMALRYLEDDSPYKGYEYRDARSSILMGLGSLVVNGVARIGALLLYAWLYTLAPFHLDTHRWWVWAYAILAIDFLYYLQHRAAHRVRILWAAHQAHHNSQYLNFATAVRQKWNPWWELLMWTPLPLLGMPPWMIFFSFSINLIFQFFVHTEKVDRLPRPIEYVFNTPSHHRVHHASDADYLDKNFAGIFIVWDRLLGTYVEETHRPTYGLTHNVDSYNVFHLEYHEYGAIIRDVRRAATWRERLGYLFAPPGWTPQPRLEHAVAQPAQ